MANCKEFELEEVRAITAIPVSKYTGMTLMPTIESSGFTPTIDSSAIVIGQRKAVSSSNGTTLTGSLVPIISGSGKVKDSEGDSTAGRLHTVTVSCEADDRDTDTWAVLLALERTPSHLLLTLRGGGRAFVWGDRDSYTCEVERDGAKTSVTLKIHNLMGLQMVV